MVSIALLIAATIAIAVFRLGPHMGQGRVVFDGTPDRPKPFGYGMAWLAVRSRDPKAVMEALGITSATPSNWNSGIGTVYDASLGEAHVYVSPPVNGWVFVVGLSLPYPVGGGFVDKFTPMMVGLGRRFAEVQYFFSYPTIDFFAWARLIDGRLVRAFAVGDEGVVLNKGRTTQEERGLGLKLFELRGVKGRKGDAGAELILHPTEEHVMRLAQRWSIDPTKLDQAGGGAGLGWVGLAPSAWRAERVRKSAA